MKKGDNHVRRILVINDDESLLEVFQLVLEPQGYDVSLSKVTYEKVQDVEALQPSLIILGMVQLKGERT